MLFLLSDYVSMSNRIVVNYLPVLGFLCGWRVGLEGAMAGHRRYFTVLETEEGHKITTERLQDGSVLWEENPSNLEDRLLRSPLETLQKVRKARTCF